MSASVLDRDALEGSPLADLHLIADQLGVDGFRRLRKAELVDAILAQQGTDDGAADEEAPKPRRSRSRSRAKPATGDDDQTTAAVRAGDQADEEEAPDEPRRGRSRGRRGGRGGGDTATEPTPAAKDAKDSKAEKAEKADRDEAVDGVIELQSNGSGFVRPGHPETSDADVYVSAAQVKRCELVSGDRVAGPVRPPRRSERHPSLVRVDTINGRPADEVVEGTRFEELAATFPTERLELGSDDATVQAVEWLTPFGKGSRVVVTGGPLAGKSDLLRRIAGALAGREGLELSIVLAGARPEEAGEWGEGISAATAALLGAAGEQQAQVVEQAVESGRRVAARGGDAVVVIDSLDALPPNAGRRALAAARNLVDGGSLTVIAAASGVVGGETTVITLDAGLTGLRRFPNVDLAASATMRPELLVGDAGAEKISQARGESLAGRA